MSLSTVCWGSLILLSGLSARILAAFGAVSGGKNNIKEKLFVSLAWLPKATVQAALGPVALGKAREALDHYIEASGDILSCSEEYTSADEGKGFFFSTYNLMISFRAGISLQYGQLWGADSDNCSHGYSSHSTAWFVQ